MKQGMEKKWKSLQNKVGVESVGNGGRVRVRVEGRPVTNRSKIDLEAP